MILLCAEPLKTDPVVAVRFIEQLARAENRKIRKFEKKQIQTLLRLVHEKYKKEKIEK